jgi:hypothetical protein
LFAPTRDLRIDRLQPRKAVGNPLGASLRLAAVDTDADADAIEHG